MSVNIKYTKEQEEELVEKYASITGDDDESHAKREDVILKYMGKHDKSQRSIIAKLSKMYDENDVKLYKSRPKVSSVTNEKAETKEQMVTKLEIKLGFKDKELEGLDKSPKLVLVKLLKRIQQD